MRFFKICLILALISIPTFSSASYQTTAQQAILVDLNSRQVLFEKAASELMAPSSMSKLMTVYMVFEKLRHGEWSLETHLPVSTKAWKTGGSKMFVLVGTTVSVEDLLRGVITQSGNDACVVLAEAIGGTEEAFSEMMTVKAQELGLMHSTFKNSTGLPDPEHFSTAKDLSLLSQILIEKFPEYYSLFSEKYFTYSGIRQMNRNPLLEKGIGVDGLKTGRTDKGGYGLAASALQEGRRLILVVNGIQSEQERARESEALIRWGYSYFVTPTLLKKGSVMCPVEVWEGEEPSVNALCAQNVTLSLPRKDLSKLKATLMYHAPVQAPVQAGQTLGKVRLSLGEEILIETPLVAAQNVQRSGVFKRLRQTLHYLIFGHYPMSTTQ